MSATSIARTVTPTVTNPYARVEIPAIGRVWQALMDLVDRLKSWSIQVSIRTLAAEAGLASAGGIPKYLRQLQEDGRIEYDPATSIVTVIPDVIDHSGDRSPITPEIDHHCDRSRIAPQCDPQPPRDHTGDRVQAACMVHESHESQRVESCATPLFFDEDDALYRRLLQHPDMLPPVAMKLVRRRFGTVADFEQDLDRAQRTPWSTDPFFLVVRSWLDGHRVPEPKPAEEASHADRSARGTDRPSGDQSGSGAGGPRRAGSSSRRSSSNRRGAPPDTSDGRAEFEAYLASIASDDTDIDSA